MNTSARAHIRVRVRECERGVDTHAVRADAGVHSWAHSSAHVGTCVRAGRRAGGRADVQQKARLPAHQLLARRHRALDAAAQKKSYQHNESSLQFSGSRPLAQRPQEHAPALAAGRAEAF